MLLVIYAWMEFVSEFELSNHGWKYSLFTGDASRFLITRCVGMIALNSKVAIMNIIADTNTFIAVALNEPEKELIIRLTDGCDLIAPEVLPFEIGNALTAMMKRRALQADEVASSWDVIQRIPVELQRINIKSALKIASKFNIYAYDAYFLECADSLRSPLLSLDRGMTRIAKEMGITVLEEIS